MLALSGGERLVSEITSLGSEARGAGGWQKFLVLRGCKDSSHYGAPL
jgi:hypothetical protein